MRLRRTIGLSLALLVASASAYAKQDPSGHNQATPSAKAKSAKAEAAAHANGAKAQGKTVARADRKHAAHSRQAAHRLPPPDAYIGPLQVIGRREIGMAAWYGGRHIGKRTASGELLDGIHATAAHRSLPLYSLVRVTNLTNGRSIVAKITDRGPVSHSLLIDLSPRVATELDMKRIGIATVSVEPVAPAQRH